MIYFSFRREKLDELFFKHQFLMKGDVIDIGGKKKKNVAVSGRLCHKLNRGNM